MLEADSLQWENNMELNSEGNQSRAQAAVWQLKVEIGTREIEVVVKIWLGHSSLVLDTAGAN